MPDMTAAEKPTFFFAHSSKPPRKLFPETWIWSDLTSGFLFTNFLSNYYRVISI